MRTPEDIRGEAAYLRRGRVQAGNDPRFRVQELADAYDIIADLMLKVDILETTVKTLMKRKT